MMPSHDTPNHKVQQLNPLCKISAVTPLRLFKGFTLALLLGQLAEQLAHLSFPCIIPTVNRYISVEGHDSDIKSSWTDNETNTACTDMLTQGYNHRGISYVCDNILGHDKYSVLMFLQSIILRHQLSS